VWLVARLALDITGVGNARTRAVKQGDRVNKTKKVAWHKHLKKAKKRNEKAHAAATPQTRQAPTRR
jgi:hypothetical protein